MLETIKTLANEFFQKLGVNYSKLHITQESENIFRIKLESEDSHLLIGPHGKNLEVITHLLRLLGTKLSKSYINIHVEVNDYLEKKDEKLLLFIASKINFVKSSGKDIILPFFTAYERKKVHSFVSECGDGVYTQSQGEGRDRRIHLCKKSKKITIDIDGNDI